MILLFRGDFMNFMNYLLEKGKSDGIIKNVVGGIIVRDNKFLILRRKSDDFMGGTCELPSGNMEIGEDIPTALIREVKEESNLDVTSIKYFVNSFDYISGSGKKARQYNFLVDVNDNEIKLTEHDEYKWMSIEEVNNNSFITDEVKYTLNIVSYNYFD